MENRAFSEMSHYYEVGVFINSVWMIAVWCKNFSNQTYCKINKIKKTSKKQKSILHFAQILRLLLYLEYILNYFYYSIEI